MHRPPAPQLHRHVRAWLVSLALGMFVLLQTLGAVHGVVHGPSAGPGGVSSEASLANSPGPNGSGAFSQHQAHSADCQLFDQLAHADLAWAPPVTWTTGVHTTDVHPVAATPSAAARALGFQARAPPRRA